MPTPTRKNTPKGKAATKKAKTPQMKKLPAGTPKSAPKSAPQVKRKKLQEEIDEQLSDEDFEALLGSVRAAEVEKKKTGKITPMKEDELDDSEEDDSDMEEEDNNDDEGVSVKTKPSKQQKAQSKKEGGILQKKRLFISHLPKKSPQEIKEKLQKLCPEAIDVGVPARKRKGEKNICIRGFAIMTFENELQSEEALKKLQEIKMDGKKIKVAFSVASSRSPPEGEKDACRLYINGSAEHMTKENLEAMFPTAKKIFVSKHKHFKMNVRHAFVVFSKEEECTKAQEKNQNATIEGVPIVVNFARKVTLKRKNEESKKAKAQPPTKKQKAAPAGKKAKKKKVPTATLL